LVGTNIIISDIVAGSTTVGCVTCMLNFTTGAFQSLTDIAGVRTWVFAPGSQTLGQFTVTGTVPTLGITSPTTLLSAFFTAPTLELTGPTGVTPRYRFFSGSLFDVKNPGLVDALLGAGFSSTYGNYFTGNYTQEFVDNLTRPSQIPILSDTLLAGSITNDTVQPEPAQVILFSSLSLVLAIGIVVRRRKSKLAAN